MQISLVFPGLGQQGLDLRLGAFDHSARQPRRAALRPVHATVATVITGLIISSGAAARRPNNRTLRRAADAKQTSGSSKVSGSPLPLSARLKKLQEVKNTLAKKYDDIWPNQAVEFIPSGCFALDRALGGGLPKGKIVEIFGETHSGKTTLALHVVREVHRAGGCAVFLDLEAALNPDLAEGIGVNMQEMRDLGLVINPTYAEQALDIVEEYIDSGEVAVIVLDSVASLVCKDEFESGFEGSGGMANVARLMSRALRKFDKKAAKSNCTLVFLNQQRVTNMSGYGNPMGTTGGNALKYHASLRLELKSGKKADLISLPGQDEPHAVKGKIQVTKNKFGVGYKTVEFLNEFGKGFSREFDVLSAAEAQGIITKKGAYRYYGDEKLGQGEQKTLERLRQDEELRNKLELELLGESKPE